MKPRFKIDDIVQIYPWGDFNEHICIPVVYWNDLMGKNLRISNVIKDRLSELKINGKRATDIFYNFSGMSFAWAEEFLKTEQPDFLPEELFEI